MEFSGDLANPGIEPRSPALQVDSLLAEPPGMPCIAYSKHHINMSHDYYYFTISSLF